MNSSTDFLKALPVAAYATDVDDRLTVYNEAAVALWGFRPALHSPRWFNSWRLQWPDGRPLPYEASPMAMAQQDGRELPVSEVVGERPDGSRVVFLPRPGPLRDPEGRRVGVVTLLIERPERDQAAIESARLAAIVASSDDAIISKTLEGRITSWNAGATRIFGWEAADMIGEPILRIIPPELHGEEEEILRKLRRSERIEHFDTVRVAKDGRRIHISLAVSPLRDAAGNVVGASKVARDVTERKQHEELQRLLFDELNHRVKNTLAMIQAIAGQSLRWATSPSSFVAGFTGRIQALARAHDLLVQRKMKGADIGEIVREQVVLDSNAGRITCTGPHLVLNPRAAVQLALVLHELATNARKHGALSVPSGRLAIEWTVRVQNGRELHLVWRESGVSGLRAPAACGFGTTLIERSLKASGGGAALRFGAEGVTCEIRMPLTEEAQLVTASPFANLDDGLGGAAESEEIDLTGKRILLVEDEVLVALDIESQLKAAGCTVVGPAETLAKAKQLVAVERCDAALVDVNLAGEPVDEIAAALTSLGIPFAFATGYDRAALPLGYQEALVLTKPFNPQQLMAVVKRLIGQGSRRPGVVALRPKRL